MFRVEIAIMRVRELPASMSTMREWLDHHRVEASFQCSSGENRLICQIDFKQSATAADFADRFGGLVRAADAGHAQSA